MNENYYLLLNLPIDKFVSGQDALDALIKQVKTWKASNNTNERNKAGQYEKPIEEAIKNAAVWKNHYDDAVKQVSQALNNWIIVVRGKGFITPDEVSQRAKSLRINSQIQSYKLSEGYVRKFIRDKGIDIPDLEPNPKPDPHSERKLEDFKPKNSIKFNQPATSLKSLSCEDVYKFLEKYQKDIENHTRNIAFSEDTDASICVKTAEAIKTAWKSKKETSEKSALETVCTLVSHFNKPNDDQSQVEYNKYLLYMKLKAILDELKSNFKGSSDQTLYESAKEVYIKRIVALVSNRADAESILTKYCTANGITVMKKAASMGLCPFCGYAFEKSNGKTPKVCPTCRKSFMLVCPTCKKESNFADKRTCDCGFNFDQYSKLAVKCEEAKSYIEILNFDFASSRINEIKKLWSNFPLLQDLEDEFNTKEKEVGKLINELKKLIKENKFQAAQREYNNIKRVIQGYSDAAIEESIVTALSTANDFYKRAQMAADNNMKLQLLIKATEVVADHSEALKALGSISPDPVNAVQCIVPPNANYVDLKWSSRNPDDTAIYVILRKEYSTPINSEDGKIAQINEKAYCDKTLKAGIPYFYSVYAMRGNNKTALCASREPVIVFPEIKNINVAPNETSVLITWNTDIGDMDVEVFRCNSPVIKNYGDGVKVSGAGKAGFEDKGLTVGTKYYYNIFLTKSAGAKKLISKAYSVMASPVKLGNKIDFEIDQANETFYINLKTTPDADEKVSFYTSERPIIIPDDGITSVPNLMNTLRLIPLTVRKEQDMRYSFTPAKNASGYIYAVSIKGDTALIGHEDYFENLEMIQTKSIRSDGTNMYIELEKWPQTANTMTVVYRTDKFASDINETGNSKVIVNKLGYKSSNIKLPFTDGVCYYISGFVRGGNGSTLVFRTKYGSEKKIQVRYHFSKGFFSKRKLIVTLPEESTLPPLIVRCRANFIPFNVHDGYLLTELNSTEKKQSFEFELPAPQSQPKGTVTNFKVFLKDENLNSKYQLMVTEGHDAKIT